ncbi:hypothetical protein BKA70DRAFT_1139835 [Coprinopsis sp. MPI-PUGE-AT-0042]|nr:hypothetical protein BKA70DRAFT_1139835 [Coprinopsis sp. MPI-PUGE-AT-0042]
MATTLGIAYSTSASSATTHYSSAVSSNGTPLSPRSLYSASSSSGSLVGGSLQAGDDENATITFNRFPVSGGAGQSEQAPSEDSEDLRLLAISTHITELSYAISDIQTRIFEIQELRHKSQSQSSSSEHGSPGSKASNVTAIIDQSLMSLDEKLESVEKGIKAVTENVESLGPRSAAVPTPTTANTITAFTTPTVEKSFGKTSEVAAILRKHTTLLSDWEAVQEDSDVLREELKEDKWLTVFRTVTDQADGMMSSLEKAVNRCQDFIYQAHHGPAGITQEDFFSNSPSSSRDRAQPVSLETFTTLLESYEAKKKHYMPATSKVLAIIDRGVRDRVTKNGETLRRHSESAQRWKTLRDRIARTDSEMENVHRLLLNQDPALSDAGSSASGTSRNGYLATPSNGKGDRNALSRSISPFRKFARKITGSTSKSNLNNSPTQPVQISPLQVSKKSKLVPASPPDTAVRTLRRQRTSLLPSARTYEPLTPERPGHKPSQSLTPDSSPRIGKLDNASTSNLAKATYASLGKGRASVPQGAVTPGGTLKPNWNGSTKVEDTNGTIRVTSGRHSRPPSASGMYKSFSSIAGYEDVPPVPILNQTGTPYRRSLSRASMASSRPWSPIGSSQSTSQSSSIPPMPISNNSSMASHSRMPSRPPSRAQTPSRSASRAASYGTAITPRARPKTPSHIPTPSLNLRSASSNAAMDGGPWSPGSDSRPFSPAFSTSGMSSTGTPGGNLHPPRPPSRSMIPIPKVHLSASSPGGRSTSSMSHIPGGYNRAGAESPTFLMSQFKAASRRAQTPDMFTVGRSVSATTPGRQSLGRLPPSSYKEGSTYSPSRPSSRTSMHDNSSKLSLSNGNEFFEYVVGNPLDPLDVEVGNVVNSIPHGLVIERVDPHLRKAPKEGEEVKAQYAFSNAFGKKIVSCRLTTLTRATRASSEGGVGEKPRVTMVTTKKVMCRVGGGWQDLGIYLMNRSQGL